MDDKVEAVLPVVTGASVLVQLLEEDEELLGEAGVGQGRAQSSWWGGAAGGGLGGGGGTLKMKNFRQLFHITVAFK